MGRRVPLKRRPRRVAAQSQSRLVFLPWILHRVLRNGDPADSELIAVIHSRRAAQRQQQHGGNAGLRFSDASRNPRLIVIAQAPSWASRRRARRLHSQLPVSR